MPDITRTLLSMLLTSVLFSANAHGQRFDHEDQYLALSGLTELKARTIVQWDMAVTMRGGTTLSEFERDLESSFALELLDIGLTLDETAPVRLDCVVSLTYVEDANATVTVSRTVRLLRPDDPEEPLGRWTVGWSRGETSMTGRDELSGSEVGRDCGAVLGLNWRRANPEG
jgi:hypothetical protein